jgi:hypothetical protein
VLILDDAHQLLKDESQGYLGIGGFFLVFLVLLLLEKEKVPAGG